jgi:subtilisin family serine protease
LCVSATNPSDKLASYSNFGISAVDIAAPGGDDDPNNPEETEETRDTQEDLILGACSRHTTQPGLAPCRLNNEPGVYFYAIAAGTSMATPHVSGAAAMVRARFPKLSVNGVRDKLLQNADDVGASGRDPSFGWGRLNVYRAVTGK